MKMIRAALALLALALPLTDALAASFRPIPGSTVSLAVTTSSARVTLGLLPSGGGVKQFRLYNAGSATVFIQFGDCSSVAATTSNLPVPSGAIEVMSFGVNDTMGCVAGITASGTATLYITTGEGE